MESRAEDTAQAVRRNLLDQLSERRVLQTNELPGDGWMSTHAWLDVPKNGHRGNSNAATENSYRSSAVPAIESKTMQNEQQSVTARQDVVGVH